MHIEEIRVLMNGWRIWNTIFGTYGSKPGAYGVSEKRKTARRLASTPTRYCCQTCLDTCSTDALKNILFFFFCSFFADKI